MVTISLDVLTLSNEDRLPLAPKCPLLRSLRDGSSLTMEPKEPYSSSSVSSTGLTLVIEVDAGFRSKVDSCFLPLMLLLLLLLSAFLMEVMEVLVAVLEIVVLLILGLLRIFPNSSSSNACWEGDSFLGGSSVTFLGRSCAVVFVPHSLAGESDISPSSSSLSDDEWSLGSGERLERDEGEEYDASA